VINEGTGEGKLVVKSLLMKDGNEDKMRTMRIPLRLKNYRFVAYLYKVVEN
jgi:hypothetical protein